MGGIWTSIDGDDLCWGSGRRYWGRSLQTDVWDRVKAGS